MKSPQLLHRRLPAAEKRPVDSRHLQRSGRQQGTGTSHSHSFFCYPTVTEIFTKPVTPVTGRGENLVKSPQLLHRRLPAAENRLVDSRHLQ